MRYEFSSLPELSHCFWELSDQWSTKQVLDFWDTNQPTEEFHKLLCKKTIAIYLECVDAPPITEPVALDKTAVENIDARLLTWVRSVPHMHVRELGNQGELHGAQSLRGTGTNSNQENPSQEQ